MALPRQVMLSVLCCFQTPLNQIYWRRNRLFNPDTNLLAPPKRRHTVALPMKMKVLCTCLLLLPFFLRVRRSFIASFLNSRHRGDVPSIDLGRSDELALCACFDPSFRVSFA
jgi:hypothetical protein